MKIIFIPATLFVLFTLCFGVVSHAQTAVDKNDIVEMFLSTGVLTRSEVDECGGNSKILDIKSIDLNKDRMPEFIGNISCPVEYGEATYVMRRTATGIDIIYAGGAREFLTPLKTYTKGWRNIRSSYYSSGSGGSDSMILRWNGNEYK